MTTYTHYCASINLRGGSNLMGPISDNQMLMLANNGTTPSHATERLTVEADRIKNLLLNGELAHTKTATIYPITEDMFRGKVPCHAPA